MKPPEIGVTYGLKITVTRSDRPGVKLTIDMPEIGSDVAVKNPAIATVMNSFDHYVGKPVTGE